MAMADLPDDVLREIARRLPCVADRDDAADVCTRWRAALAQPLPLPAPPRPLPWLLLPSHDSTRAWCFFCRSADACAICPKVCAATYGARYFGSYDGGWLFLAYGQTAKHALVNVRALRPDLTVRFLPDVLLPAGRAEAEGHRAEDMVILAATLSSPPGQNNCVAAGIVKRWQLLLGQRQPAFWLMGDEVAMDVVPDDLPCQPSLEVEDVVYHNGPFHFLTQGEHLRVCAPLFHQGGGLDSVSHFVCFFQARERDDLTEPVIARYLVESHGDLLMVIRCGMQFASPYHRLPTSEFKIFKMMEKHVITDDGIHRVDYTWNEMENLDGCMLFVGRGCSRAYNVAEYVNLGLEEGVFFMDEQVFNDEAMFFRDFRHRKYPGVDNGRWSEWGSHLVDPCFPKQPPSKVSSPVWLLP